MHTRDQNVMEEPRSDVFRCHKWDMAVRLKEKNGLKRMRRDRVIDVPGTLRSKKPPATVPSAAEVSFTSRREQSIVVAKSL